MSPATPPKAAALIPLFPGDELASSAVKEAMHVLRPKALNRISCNVEGRLEPMLSRETSDPIPTFEADRPTLARSEKRRGTAMECLLVRRSSNEEKRQLQSGFRYHCDVSKGGCVDTRVGC